MFASQLACQNLAECFQRV